MNRQVASVDTNNAAATKHIHNKLTILNHQPAGKRRALSTITSRQGNIPVSSAADKNKDYLKAAVNKGLHAPREVAFNKGFHAPRQAAVNKGLHAPRELPQQCMFEKPALRHITEQKKTEIGFKIFCDEEQNKENTRPFSTISEKTAQATLLSYPPLNFESPGVQNDKEEEEILIVDSPMVVDTSLGNLSLKEQHQNNEFLLPEYSQEIYAYLKGVEVRLRPRVNYMKKQTDITSPMRRILVDWLVEVCQEYKMDQETLYLAVSYIDRFLSCMAVLRAKLQLVGTACMFIAAKYEEIYPPDVSEFVYITDDTYTKQQVLRMEHLVLKVLSFDLSVPTANFFLLRFCSLCKVPAPTECLARYLCELCLLEADPFLKYLPSEIACASLALANHTMGKEMWTSELRLVTEYTEEDFRECLENLYMFYLEAATYPQQAIQEKYKLHKYHCVSSITPPPSLPLL